MSYQELDTAYQGGNIEDLRAEVHQFSKEVVRPAAREIDRMDREEYQSITDADSPYWAVMRQLKSELGAHRATIPAEFGGGGMSGREWHVLLEELAWGSPGLAIGFGVDLIPAVFASIGSLFGEGIEEQFLRPWMEDEDAAFQGCWGVTEPNHGSELVQTQTLLKEGTGPAAEIDSTQASAEKEGDEWVINGMKSSWVSAGPLATHCALHVNMDPEGGDPGALCLVPLDTDGVTKGDPIDKLGQRDCPQGELIFENARIPEENMLMSSEMLHPETGYVPMTQILCITSAGMAAIATGLARAAFEEALAYARDREQGGKPIYQHQSVQAKLYDMFEKVETCRAYSRQITEHVWDRNLVQFEFDASHRHAVSAQVYCKQMAYEVAHEALQIHGANGITTDYLIEKLFRDARVKLIEDGTTEVLGLESAAGVIENYEIE